MNSRSRYSVSGAVALAVLLSGCTVEQPLSAPALAIEPGPVFLISDGAHGGNLHFFWLPPLAPATVYGGRFDPSLNPTVTICELVGSTCGRTLAIFTATTDARPEGVRVDPENALYIVNWESRRSDLSTAGAYRVTVTAALKVLGHIDLKAVKNAEAAKRIDRTRFAIVIIGATLPIKFRIEEGALSLPSDLRRVDGLSATAHVLHVNPLDPVVLTRPVAGGELVQIIALKDAAGMPVKMLGLRKFSLANPMAYDQLSLNERNLPALVTLRDGAQVLYDYLPGGRVRMTVVRPDGTSRSVFFNFTPASGVNQAKALRTSNHQRPLSLLSAATAPLTIRVAVTEGAAASPVNDASVTGLWIAASGPEDAPLIGQFLTQPVDAGYYQSTIPTAPAPVGIIDGVLQGCVQNVELISAVCDGLTSGGAFLASATAACPFLLEPASVAICLGAATTIHVLCELQVCDLYATYFDGFMQALTTIVWVRASGVGYFENQSTVVTWPPPSTIDLAIGIPDLGFTGRWLGTWSFQDGSQGGPAAFTLREEGSSVTGTYDLFYAIIPIDGTVAGQTLTFGYRGYGSVVGYSSNVITLTRSGPAIAGQQIAYFDQGGSYTWPIAATRSGASLFSTAGNVTMSEDLRTLPSQLGEGQGRLRPPVPPLQ